MQTRLMNASGGFEALGTNVSTFFQGFYSDTERMAILGDQVRAALSGLDVGIDPAMGDKAKAEYKALVQSTVAGGNAELAAQLYALSGTFKVVADDAQSAMDKLSETMRGLLADRKSLEAEMLRAMGDDAGYAAAKRANAIEGYTGEEAALWDSNTALQAYIDSLDAASAAAKTAAEAEAQAQAAIEQARYGMDGQVLQLLGDTAAMRARELAALDPALRAQQEYIWSLQDTAKAAQEAAAAQQQLQQTARGVLQSHVSLAQEHINALQQSISEAQGKLSQLTSDRQWAAAEAGRTYGQAGAASTEFLLGFATTWEQYAGSMGALADGFAGLEDAQQAAVKELEEQKAAAQAQAQVWQNILSAENQQLNQLMSIEDAIGVLTAAVQTSTPVTVTEQVDIGKAVQADNDAWIKANTITNGHEDGSWYGGHEADTRKTIIDNLTSDLAGEANDKLQQAIIAAADAAIQPWRTETPNEVVEEVLRQFGVAHKLDYNVVGAKPVGGQTSTPGSSPASAMAIAEYRQLAQMQQQYWQLTGDEASIRKATLAAMHPQLQTMQEQLWLVEAQQKQLAAFNGAMSGLLDAGYGLDTDLLRLRGDEAGAVARERARDLDQLFEGITDVDMQAQITAQYDRNQSLRDEATALQKAKDAAVGRQQSAWANLEAAVDREKSYWQEITGASQEAISSLSGTLDLLTSNAKDLYGTVDSAAQWQAAAGMVYVEDALAAVLGGADVTGLDGLADAISAARDGISDGNYASAFERERDALVLAGQLSQLGDLTGDQLSVEERALKAAQSQIEQLDQTLDFWRDALDYDKQQIDATLSVQGAVAQLSAVMQSSLASSVSAAQAAASGYVTSPVNENGSHTGVGDSGYRIDGNTLYFPDGGSHSVEGPDAAQILMDAYGLKPGGLNGTLIRTRAAGGYTPPGLTLVGEEGPELVNFRAPSMVYTAAQSANLMGTDTERLEALVERMADRIERLEGLLGAVRDNTFKTAQVLVHVTDDGNAMVTQELETL